MIILALKYIPQAPAQLPLWQWFWRARYAGSNQSRISKLCQ